MAAIQMPPEELVLPGELDEPLGCVVDDLFLPVLCVEIANQLEPGLHLGLAHQGSDLPSCGLEPREYRGDMR